MFRGKDVEIQLQEEVSGSTVLVAFKAPISTGPGTTLEFLGGCTEASVSFKGREQALRFARRLAIALGVTASAYGSGRDAMDLGDAPPAAPPVEPAKPDEKPRPRTRSRRR